MSPLISARFYRWQGAHAMIEHAKGGEVIVTSRLSVKDGGMPAMLAKKKARAGSSPGAGLPF